MKVFYQAKPIRFSGFDSIKLPVFLDKQRRIMPAQTQYMAEQIESGYWNSEHTVRSNQEAIEQFSAFLESKMTALADVQLKDVVAWRRSMYEKAGVQAISNQTINVRMRAVVRFIEWAMENAYILDKFYGMRVETFSQGGGVQFNQKQRGHKIKRNRLLLPERSYRAPLPTMEEINRFVAYVSKPFVPMVGLMLGTGMRISEVISLPRSALPSYAMVVQNPNILHDIRLAPGSMTIKNNKARQVFIPGRLYMQIYEQAMNCSNEPSHRWLFVSPKKSTWHASTIQKDFRQASAKANLRHVITPHVLRHVFATRTLENWKESGFTSEMACLIWLQKQLGHSHVSTTANIYINMTSELHANDRQMLHQYEQEIYQLIEEVDDV